MGGGESLQTAIIGVWILCLYSALGRLPGLAGESPAKSPEMPEGLQQAPQEEKLRPPQLLSGEERQLRGILSTPPNT